ncbi:MAG: alkaline phosphatase D family protein [Parerythrobacter sp.]
MRAILSASALLAAFAATPGIAQTPVSLTPDQLLEPYYEALRQTVTLPQAGPNASLPADTVLTRFAFGSCNHQSRSQHMWAQIAAKEPQMFMLIGDNVYGDTAWGGDAGLLSLREAYAEQASRPEFAQFRAATPMLTTWDDHDYGLNDSGGVFPFKGWAEDIYEEFWDSPADVRARPGIYESRIYGVDGQRVQVLLLDTRYFRSPLIRMEYTPERPPLGVYVPHDVEGATILGGAQWDWLEAELEKPADLRVVVSSIQILTEAHNYESWENFPNEREKLLDMLGAREGSGLLLLSGDRHAGGIYTEERGGETLWELTSSSLNLAFGNTPDNTAREPDPRRVTDFIAEENFGVVDIDWAASALTLSLHGSKGEIRATRTVAWQ